MVVTMKADERANAHLIITERKAPRCAGKRSLGEGAEARPGRVGSVGSASHVAKRSGASGLQTAVRKLGETLGYIPEAKPGVDLPCLDMGVSLAKGVGEKR